MCKVINHRCTAWPPKSSLLTVFATLKVERNSKSVLLSGNSALVRVACCLLLVERAQSKWLGCVGSE